MTWVFYFSLKKEDIKFIFIYQNLTFSPLFRLSMNLYNVQSKEILRVNVIFDNTYSKYKK